MTDEERKQRIHHHMYTTCEGIAEHAERIVALEELCADMWVSIDTSCFGKYCAFNVACNDRHNEVSCLRLRHIVDRMDELGVPHD